MGYVPKNRRVGSRPRTDLLAGASRPPSFSSLRRKLERKLQQTSQEIIIKTGFDRPTPPNIPKVIIKEVSVVEGRFRLICQHLDIKIHEKPVSLTMHIPQDLIGDFERIVAILPAVVSHELGHMVFPPVHFQGKALPNIALPFGRTISFPESNDLQTKDYQGWEEMCMDVIGINLMADAKSRQEIRTSFLELSKLCLSELFVFYPKKVLARSFMATRFIAMIRHLNRDKIPTELLPLLDPLLKDTAANDLIEDSLRFIGGTTVS